MSFFDKPEPEPEAPALRPKYTVATGFNFNCKSDPDATDDERWGTRVNPGPLVMTLPQDVLVEAIEARAIVEAK